MEMKISRLFIPVILFVTGFIFLVLHGNVLARDLYYYESIQNEDRIQLLKHETGETVSEKTPSINLRSSYRNLSLSQVHSMPHIAVRKRDEWGLYGHCTMKHNYEKKSIHGDEVVIDHATGLMWHQSGSDNYMRWSHAKNWMRNLNRNGYAGFQDWRLPTLEEAASLLEPARKNNLYIDPVFHNEQWGIWSGDSQGSDGVWSVYFSLGNVRWNVKNRFVRPVRSIDS